MKNQHYVLLFAAISLILFVLIFKWIDFLSKNQYIIEEGFDAISNTVDLPLTTTYSCDNFCGPTARCSITGHQCSADIDCPGCQPYSPPLKDEDEPVPGDNDAGKLTFNLTPQYSSLTSGYGTFETKVSSLNPTSPNLGVNIWKDEFEEEQSMFYKRYKPSNSKEYEKRYSLTGIFIDDGPFPSNSTL